ncbi:hypothetical protein B1813_12680 [Saccharomonospora piscinae]|uniref:Uncharacterized protein n=1 Tax=Saccharomonospora piscinae TaxID=687388 RepID=A0A1V9A793_SACPI|nr:hypothetical protein [Saccharomonospora piscinae]OQO92963.1 hypothetical protein B1813_12680 [Saccharomonospora piscinae]TLW93099.1 hypothetical protein FFT09_06625 [Saccharomonospora piscinae]
MSQDTVTEHQNGEEPAERTAAPETEKQPPLPPTGWDPYAPPAPSTPSTPSAPTAPPSPVAPAGWDPYAPPVRSAPVAPAGWDPYTPPVRSAPPAPPHTATAQGMPVPPAPVPGPAGDQAAPAGGWVRGAAITHLWSAADAPGVWVAVAGLGWKPLAASDSGSSQLTLLAVLARNYRLAVAYHEDARGHIDQLLV